MSALRHLPLAALRVDDALTVLDGSLDCVDLLDAGAGDDLPARLTEALATHAALADELALATAQLLTPGATTQLEWQHGDRMFEVVVRADGDSAYLVTLQDVTDVRQVERIQQGNNKLKGIIQELKKQISDLNAKLAKLKAKVDSKKEKLKSLP